MLKQFSCISTKKHERELSSITPVISETPSEEFINYVNSIYTNILVNNKLMAINLIDQSGTIIFEISNLITALALRMGITESDITITYADNDDSASCTVCQKLNPVKEVSSIKIGSSELQYTYNTTYCEFKDTYKISLSNVYVSSNIMSVVENIIN